MRIIIVANGIVNSQFSIGEYDLVIAANGGLLNCLELDIKPDIVIGDMDSIESHILENLKKDSVQIVRHSPKKDFTDLELALLHARELKADEVVLVAALGARWDQTLANLLLPANYPEMNITIMDNSLEIYYLFTNGVLNLVGIPGDIVSLIPINGDVSGSSTLGLEYPLDNETLKFGSSRGVSNVLVDTTARISIQSGKMICMVLHEQE